MRIEDFIRDAISGGRGDTPPEKPTADLQVMATDLRHKFKAWNTAHIFAVGDLVEWKPGFSTMSGILSGSPMVVLEMLDPDRARISPSQDPLDWHFHQVFDVVIGLLHPSDWTLFTFHLQSRRLQPYSGPQPLMDQEAEGAP